MTKDVHAMCREYNDDINLLIDSGAFSVWRTGKQIRRTDYQEFLDSLKIELWNYFMLDVIGDPQLTLNNYEAMLFDGYNPIPVLTPGSDQFILDEYKKTASLIGMGGIAVNKTQNKNLNYIDGILKKNTDVNFHLLGFTSLEYLKYFKPYSCDSTTWINPSKYGQIALYMGNGNIKWMTRSKMIEKLPHDIYDYIRSIGYDPKQLQYEASWRGKDALSFDIGIATWILKMRDLEKRLDTKLFLAISGKQFLEKVLNVFQHLKDQKCI